jgi:histidinol-phosphatase (PHP family)
VVDGELTPPVFDHEGYLASIERCRSTFPDLRILTGVELGEPHWHRDRVAELLGTAAFTRVLASVHSAVIDAQVIDVCQRFLQQEPAQVYADYLTELETLVSSYHEFEVLAHVDYPLRYWPAGVARDPAPFEDQLRHVLELLSEAGKVLEVNTRVPLPPARCSRSTPACPCLPPSCGGGTTPAARPSRSPPTRIVPTWMAHGFAHMVALAEEVGFRRASDPLAYWVRAG